MDDWKVRRALQTAIDNSMSAYRSAENKVGLALHVVPASIAITAAATIGTSWLLGDELKFDKSVGIAFGIVSALYVGYICRCYFEARDRVDELGSLFASAGKLGFKIVFNPVDGGEVQDGLRVVEAEHPSNPVEARWGRWDSLSAFVR